VPKTEDAASTIYKDSAPDAAPAPLMEAFHDDHQIVDVEAASGTDVTPSMSKVHGLADLRIALSRE
jgi:hypothetical protein